MKIKQINKTVQEIIGGGTYLGCGASKEAFLKNGKVYKVPRGRYLLEKGGFGENLVFPDRIEEVDNFLEEVDNYEPALVWPLGQFAIELIIWQTLLEIEKEGYDIGCFARITDFYLDKNGVIVVEQEATDRNVDHDGYKWEIEVEERLEKLQDMLEIHNIVLRDVRSGNMGMGADGQVKLFDFGISTTTSIDDYGSYSDYQDYRYEDEEDY